MTFRTMRPGEEVAWAEFCARVFGGETDTPEYFLSHFLNDPYGDRAGIFIAEAEGEIISSVHVLTREIYIRGQRVKMGGIGDVATSPEYRRGGLSGKLLTMAIDYMNDRKMPVSLLFSGVNRHYANYGWFTHPTRFARVALPKAANTVPLEEAHFTKAMGLHGLTAPRFNGCVAREHPLYDAWVKREIKNPLGLSEDGRLVAYIGWDRFEDGAPYITEYGALPGRDRFLELLASTGAEHGYVPSGLLPESRDSIRERISPMLRLNAPFYLGDARIDTNGKLASAMEDMVFFDTDGY